MVLKAKDIKNTLPKEYRTLITDDLVNKLNSLSLDNETKEFVNSNATLYANYFKDGKYSKEEYYNAIIFVTLRLMRYSDIDCWMLTFPEKVERIRTANLLRPDQVKELKRILHPYASGYKSTKLVTALIEASFIPSYVINAPKFQEAIDLAMGIARNERANPMARVKAIETILNYTKQPEIKKLQLDIGTNNSDALENLLKASRELAEIQKKQLNNKSLTAKEILDMDIIEADIEETKVEK